MFPVEEKLDEVRRALASNREVVLTAPPGSGKTTCVPPALLGEPWLGGKKIVMLEPRRLAARNCAEFMARRMGEDVGGTVGYHVRLERRVSSATRLEIVTEGLLAQRLLSDMELSDVGLVVFDEFHERSLACDLSFALALEVRRALRPDLRIMAMSATLDVDEVAARLGNAEIVRAEGRMYPVETVYLGDTSMAAAIARALRETTGDILCFLPGEGEIRRVNEAYPGALPLYGSLSREEQDRVFREGGGRKIVLATSIAETSLTVPGVTCVIDSGLMRVPRFSPATGMSGLVTLPLSLDRAEQRRGRAGRVRPGVCYRLWSETAEASRPKKMTPEILESDLASLALASFAWGAARREDLPWMTPPGASAWERAVSLLKSLGAVDSNGRITTKGVRMSKLPMHPRLANMILGGGDPVLAAIIEEGARTRETDIRRVPVDARIRRLSRRFAIGEPKPAGEGAMLALAYPDRIAKNRGNATFRMVSGRGAYLDREDPLAFSPYLVCCKLDDREGDAKIFLACPIAEDEIEEMFAGEIVRETICEWDSRAECVKCAIRRRLGAMTLDERSCRPSGSEDRIAAALLDGIRAKGVENLPCWTKETRQLRARVDFLSARCGWPKIGDAEIIEALAGFVGGMSRWRDLEKIDLSAVYGYMLSERGYDRRELDRLAPAKMQVPSGSNMTIRYEGAEPTVEVRLQECFGLVKTPTVADGTVPIVMTLLSPAQRPVQVTKDLEGFWKGAYQIVRKDMRGRYPKHYWPEDPFSAVATRRVRPK